MPLRKIWPAGVFAETVRRVTLRQSGAIELIIRVIFLQEGEAVVHYLLAHGMTQRVKHWTLAGKAWGKKVRTEKLLQVCTTFGVLRQFLFHLTWKLFRHISFRVVCAVHPTVHFLLTFYADERVIVAFILAGWDDELLTTSV